jgi:hypothetical protein
MSAWSYDGYSVQHWQAMVMEAFIELYAGDGARAFDRVQKDERAAKRSFLLLGQFVRGTHGYIRGIAAVAASQAGAGSRTERLAEARKMALKLEKEQMAWTAPLAAIVSAGASSAEGDGQSAAASLERAIELALAADMSLYAAAAPASSRSARRLVVVCSPRRTISKSRTASADDLDVLACVRRHRT